MVVKPPGPAVLAVAACAWTWTAAIRLATTATAMSRIVAEVHGAAKAGDSAVAAVANASRADHRLARAQKTVVNALHGQTTQHKTAGARVRLVVCDHECVYVCTRVLVCAQFPITGRVDLLESYTNGTTTWYVRT